MMYSRRDYMRLMSVLVEIYDDMMYSRRDYMRLMCILVGSRRDLCGFVYFFMGALDIIAFLWQNVGLTHKTQTPSYKTFYYSYNTL